MIEIIIWIYTLIAAIYYWVGVETIKDGVDWDPIHDTAFCFIMALFWPITSILIILDGRTRK